ncbi:LacI family DNA-binding transcriptional regulator [Oceaniglobus indicus]|uniref:LacI family DNA-binding transcriptional regulator n=1 Tax=Oceaniglobus indicus TaxID=2047749 RepID=UPI000C179CCC|nr:LacI family DNA-binding transcriptional regulator [Oceaniglobus indicus]
MGKRPTILTVAARAGVSKSTVSLVLRDSPLVHGDTAEAVRTAMAEVGYVYNRAAATLRGSTVNLVGLVINDLRNPFFTEFATSVQMALDGHGHAAVIANTDEDPATQHRVVGSMIEHGVRGVIISPAYGDTGATFDRLELAGIPTLQVLRRTDPQQGRFPFAGFDIPTGGALAARHLFDQGARRIAFVGGLQGREVTAERMAGYLSVMAEKGIAPTLFTGASTRAFGRETADLLCTRHPEIDAAICFNDQVALGMMAGFARHGRALGSGFKLVGCDDIRECSEVWPPLSSISCDIAAFGRQSAARLLDWMENGTRPAPIQRADVALVARESSDAGFRG